MQKVSLAWFRRDLRIEDNQMLFESTKGQSPLIPFFIVDPFFYENWEEIGAFRVQFMLECLESLEESFKSFGIPFYIFYGNSNQIIEEICKNLKADNFDIELYFNRDRQIEYGKDRDGKVIEFCRNFGIKTEIHSSSFLVLNEFEMDTWRKKYYTYQSLKFPEIIQNLEALKTNQQNNNPKLNKILSKIETVSRAEFKSKFSQFFDKPKSKLFIGGENQAKIKLKTFLEIRSSGYHWKVSRPELAFKGATSHLSPHIMWGSISTRQIYLETKKFIQNFNENQEKSKRKFSLNSFLDRLCWRESFTQRLYFHPEYATQNWYSDFDEIYNLDNLSENKKILLEAWKNGQTGFPLIDASMRQLKEIGWLNFRMRAMVATFLCINLGISWQHGAKHFMNCLVDGDVAIDHWQWQMQSGVTNPLQKTFRIYNPQKNLIEKDPKLEFIRRWVPELQKISNEDILNDEIKSPNYPSKIIDFKETRLKNGAKINQIRTKVRERIIKKHGLEFEEVKTQKKVSEKYSQGKNKQHKKIRDETDLRQDLFS